MRISEVAARSGVAPTALRYYETLGLIEAQRGSNGYRSFDDHVLERLDFIGAAKQLNLSLPEIRDLLLVSETATCTKVKATLQPLLSRQLRELEFALDSASRLRERLAAASEHVAECPDSDDRCGSECAFAVLNNRPFASADQNVPPGGAAREWRLHFPDAAVTTPAGALELDLPRQQLDRILRIAATQQEHDPQLVITIELRGPRVRVSIPTRGPT